MYLFRCFCSFGRRSDGFISTAHMLSVMIPSVKTVYFGVLFSIMNTDALLGSEWTTFDLTASCSRMFDSE